MFWSITIYKYETHLHTSPVSLCAKSDVEDNLHFYKNLGSMEFSTPLSDEEDFVKRINAGEGTPFALTL